MVFRVIISIFMLILTGCSTSNYEPYVTVPKIGERILQFDNLIGSDLKLHSLSDFEGAPMLLIFEAVECPYCEKESQFLIELQKKYDELQVVTIAVSETIEDVKKHIDEKGIDNLWLIEGDKFVSIAYLINGTPDHFFVDRNGILISRIKGYTEFTSLEENILKIIE